MKGSKTGRKTKTYADRLTEHQRAIAIEILDSVIQDFLRIDTNLPDFKKAPVARVIKKTNFWAKKRAEALTEISKIENAEDRKRYLSVHVNLNSNYFENVVMVAPRGPYPRKRPPIERPKKSPSPRKEPTMPDEWNFD